MFMSVGDEHLEYLESVKFEKQLVKHNKKLKNKTIVIYGTGILFQKILKNYDLSNLNIIGVSDRRFTLEQEGEDCLGYKIIPLDKINEYEPDCVLIATLKFLGILDNFRNNIFKNTKTKVLPLVDKPFLTLLKEIFEN